MKLKIFLVGLFLLTFQQIALSQYVKGEQTFVTAEASEDGLFELSDSTEVFVYPIKNNWYKVSTVVFVARENFNAEDSTVDEGVYFINLDGDTTGQTLAKIEVLEHSKIKGRKFKNFEAIRIEGWCFYTKIHSDLIPEVQILKLLNGRQSNVEDKLFEMQEAFGLTQKEAGDYVAYVFPRTLGEISENPDFQYIVILRGGSVFAVVSRERHMELDKVKFQKQEWDFFISFYQKPNSTAESDVIDIAYTFEKL